MGRTIRGNGRWIRALIGVADQPSVDLANSLARATLTSSPMSRGAQGYHNQGLPGAGVNAFSHLTDPLQQFIGIGTSHLVNPSGKYGNSLAGSLPGSVATSGAVAWMDLGSVVGTGYGS